MAYITAAELQAFANKYLEDSDTEGLALLTTYCQSAMEAVRRYLGYSPESATITERVSSCGGTSLILSAPIVSATSLDGEEGLTFSFKKNYLSVIEDGAYRTFDDGVLHTVSYTGGYSSVPSEIKTTALQIASLYWESAGGNLAVSSTSFADLGTRVYNNFTVDRFLSQLNEYRIYNA